MILEKRLRLLKAILAAKRSHGAGLQRRVFVREEPAPEVVEDGVNRVFIKSDLPRWQWAFLEAREGLGLKDIAVSAIQPNHWYSAPSTGTIITAPAVEVAHAA